MRPRLSLRLKLVAAADFRKGVPTMMDDLRRAKKLVDLSGDEVVLLISATGLQLAFVFRDVTIEDRSRVDTVKCTTHYRVQLDRHTPWNPLMLVNYAEEAGIELQGLKRFEEHLFKGEVAAHPAAAKKPPARTYPAARKSTAHGQAAYSN